MLIRTKIPHGIFSFGFLDVRRIGVNSRISGRDPSSFCTLTLTAMWVCTPKKQNTLGAFIELGSLHGGSLCKGVLGLRYNYLVGETNGGC